LLRIAVTAVAAIALSQSAAGASANPVHLAASFGGGARLGARTSVSLALRLDPRLGPATEVRLLTPAGLDLSSSRLGAASCHRPASEIATVMVPIVRDACPANSLLGSGAATAGLLLDPNAPTFGAGRIALHAGAPVLDKPGLVVLVNTYNPVRMQLTYAGYLYVPPPGFGVGLAILIPQIPAPPFGAPVALSTMHLTVGDNTIVYSHRVRGRLATYHPGGIPLPSRCPNGGFRFRSILRFAVGPRRQADSLVACPEGHSAKSPR
jgi:hypothetical protein